jgi:alkylhydroperoxidase family enzyme
MAHEPRIAPVDAASATDGLAAGFARVTARMGRVSNLWRTFGNRPDLAAPLIAHWEAMLFSGTVPQRLKELAILRTSQINGCEY